jgi:hypothetical protein
MYFDIYSADLEISCFDISSAGVNISCFSIGLEVLKFEGVLLYHNNVTNLIHFHFHKHFIVS